MLDPKNRYFEEMKQIGHAWEDEKEKRLQEKRHLMDVYGKFSDEVNKWYTENPETKFPFTSGQQKAYHCFYKSCARLEDELDVDEGLFEEEVESFLETLRSAGIKSFMNTNSSTLAMPNLFAFVDNGCSVEGFYKIQRQETRWGYEDPYEVNGIKFLIR